jgi:photosystem II stability/assembly factor-like uncharacterized protein
MSGARVRLGLIGVALGCALGVGGCASRDDAVVVIALHPKNPHILYVATNEYIYKSRDEGRSWEKISGGMSHSRVISMAIDPAYPATVYAGTKGDAVYKSYDGGQRWVAQKTGLDDVTFTSVVNQIVFDPGIVQPLSSSHSSSSDLTARPPRPHVQIDTPVPMNRLFAATSMGIFESVDGGDRWTKRMAGMKEVLVVVSLAIDPAHPDVMYAGTSGGVYKSLDHGRTWAKAHRGLISPELLSSSRALMVNVLAINPQQPEVVYVATLNGLYKSVNAGDSWQRIGQSLPDQMIIAVALSPSLPSTVYVASRQGIFKSVDGGMTWKDTNHGLHSLNIRSLALSAMDANTMYVGTNGTGLYRSRDGGENWESLPLSVASRN